ncbi:MAG: hypothetical protein ACI8TQ_003800 [Planctomycetota bacterium]|jgi:hypothetical protein
MRIARTFCGLTALLVLSLNTSAQKAPTEAEAGLPYFDARLSVDGPLDNVSRAIVEGRSADQASARFEALQRLSSRVPSVRVDNDQFFGTPHFIGSSRALLTEPNGFTPRGAVSNFVGSYTGLFEIAPTELGDARMEREFVTEHNGVTHFTYQQQIDGIDIWGAELKANVTADGALINISSTMIPRPEEGFATPTATFDASDALAAAAANAGIEMTAVLRPASEPVGVALKQTWISTEDFRANSTISSELIWFALTRTQVHPAWKVVIPVPGIGHTYETIVDATNGSILRRWDGLHFYQSTENLTVNVWTDDSPQPGSPGNPTPNGFQFPLVPRTLVTVTPAMITDASPDGWIDDGDNETIGNNVEAHTDLNADNLPDLPRPTGSPYRVFDFVANVGVDAPSVYADASVTNLFYLSNIYHDRLYRLGWDEAASNLQDDNFGLGGVGGDRLIADAQDGFGTNNANFSGSGSDGTSARIQQFVFDGPTPDIDGGLDSDIVYHEISHGLSIRLSGGTVFGSQAGGMGEGWGDYFGISLNADASDDPDAVYATGGYATHEFLGTTENYYWGIRRYPYSTDLSKSPLTYADIDPTQFVVPVGIPNNSIFIGNPSDGVHNAGEIWCQALLECRSEMWANMGFAANEELMQLVVDGLKLMPSTPNMLQARDAVLQADIIRNGGSNLAELWAGFAKRGMGDSATSPAGTTAIGIVEAFDIPALVAFTYPSGLPTQLMPSASTTIPVNITTFGTTVMTPGSGMLNYNVNGGSAQTSSLVDLGGGSFEAVLPGLNCFDTVDYWVSITTNQGAATSPALGAAAPFGAQVFTSITTLFSDDFESNLGWTVGDASDTATTGIWERDDPIGTAAAPEDDNSDPGTQCFLTGLGYVGNSLGFDDVDGGATTLTSPAIDLSSGDAEISYARWYSNDTGGAPNADIFRVEVSNGGAFVNVETVGPAGAGTSGGWLQHTFNVSDFVTPNANIQVRFIAEDAGTGSLVEAGVDDFLVFRRECDETCQLDLGFGGPGDLAFSICGADLSTGNTATFLMENADPFALSFIVIGATNNPTPLFGGTLVPIPAVKVISRVATAMGKLTFPVSGGNGPATAYLQLMAINGAFSGGVEISNAIELQLLP